MHEPNLSQLCFFGGPQELVLAFWWELMSRVCATYSARWRDSSDGVCRIRIVELQLDTS